MGLAVIAAAAEVAAAAEHENHLATLPLTDHQSRSRTGSTLSDSTVPDSDPFESDSSAHLAPPPRDPPLKKRRSEHPSSSKRPPADDPASPQSQPEPQAFPAEMLLDLAGSTSAEVRRMTEDERALVHYKRRLRNRESAKRSRARRQATISDIQLELEDLRQVTASLVDRCMSFARTNDRQSQELETLRKEKQLLESMLRSGPGSIL